MMIGQWKQGILGMTIVGALLLGLVLTGCGGGKATGNFSIVSGEPSLVTSDIKMARGGKKGGGKKGGGKKGGGKKGGGGVDGTGMTATIVSQGTTRRFTASIVWGEIGLNDISVSGTTPEGFFSGISLGFPRPSSPSTITLTDFRDAGAVLSTDNETFISESGTLRLTTLTDQRVVGEFQFTTEEGISVSGQFSVPRGVWQLMNGRWERIS